MSEKVKNLQAALERLQNKEYKVIFMVPDTKGIARGSVAVTYNHAMTLHKNGVKVIMLHDKNDFMSVGAWMGDEYDKLEHISIESNKLEVSASDFLVIPEVYGNIVEKIQHLPCQKIVFVQSVEYMLDTYSPGKTWLDYGVLDTMTTSPEAAQFLSDLMYIDNVKVVPIGVPDFFKPYKKLKKPLVAIHCKEPRKTARILKMFYIKYPYLRWITFRDMHGMTQADFANNLSECILAIWSDHTSTFPLFLVEAIKSDVPIIAQMPAVLQDWMTDEFGSFAFTDLQIVELAARFLKSWLEDNVPQEFHNLDKLLEDRFTMKEMEENVLRVYGEYAQERAKTITDVIAKLQADENKTETPQTNEEQN